MRVAFQNSTLPTIRLQNYCQNQLKRDSWRFLIMDLCTESLNFNAFLLFICLFLTADRLSPHEQLSRKYLISINMSYFYQDFRPHLTCRTKYIDLSFPNIQLHHNTDNLQFHVLFRLDIPYPKLHKHILCHTFHI